MKKRILLFIFFVVLILSILICFYKESNYYRVPDLKNIRIINIGKKYEESFYLFYLNKKTYYLNNYKPEESYVIINTEGNIIDNIDVDEAKKNIYNKNFNFNNKDGNLIKIYYLREALYNYIIDISWAEQLTDIYIKSDNINIENIKLNTKKKSSLQYIDLNNTIINLYDIDVNKLLINEKEYSLNEALEKNINIDALIEIIEKENSLEKVIEPGKYTKNEKKIFYGNLIIEHEYRDYKSIYYVYSSND